MRRKPTRWLAFLGELWGGDAETISTLQEMFGYLVSGDTRHQKMFLLVGPKRGGKGTIARVLDPHDRSPQRRRTDARQSRDELRIAGSDRQAGRGHFRRPDRQQTDGSLIAERLLSVSGEDLRTSTEISAAVVRLSARRASSFSPTSCRVHGPSGRWRAASLCSMLHRSFYGRENPALTEQLCEELPGIFNWALWSPTSSRAREVLAATSSRDAFQELEDLC